MARDTPWTAPQRTAAGLAAIDRKQQIVVVLEVERLHHGVRCPGDIDENGAVGTSDLLMLLSAWGPVRPDHPADFDGDGTVSTNDLLLLLSGWGSCS